MRKDETFTLYEGVSLLSLTFLYHVFNEVIPTLVVDAGTSAWMAQIISVAVGLALLGLYRLASRRYPDLDFLQILDRACGKALGRMIQALLLMYLLAYAASCLNQAEETLQLYAYTDFNSLTLDLFLMGAVAVYALFSIRGMAKTVSVFLPLILAALLLILLICYNQYDIHLLTPLWGYGFKGTAANGVKMGSQFGGIVILGIFGSSFPDRSAFAKSALWSMLTAGGAIVLTTLCYTMAVPYYSAKNQLSGVMGVAEANYNSRFLQRVESMFIAILVMAILLLVGISFLAIKKTYCHIFAIPSRASKAVVAPLALLVICVVRTMGNLQEFKQALRYGVRRYSIFALGGILLLVLLAGLLREKGRGRFFRAGTLLLIPLCLMLALSGCGGYREIDSEIYPLMMGYDKGENEKYRITLRFMQPTEGGGEEGGGGKGDSGQQQEGTACAPPPDVMVFEAPSFIEGINLANALIPKRISMLHIKMLVISEELAREGLSTIAAPLIRYNEIKPTMALVISKSSAYEFIAAKQPAMTDSLQMELELILEANNESAPYTVVSLADFLYHYDTSFGDAVAMLGNLNQADYRSRQEEGEAPDRQIARTAARFRDGFSAGNLPVTGHGEMELAGMAVFHQDRMAGELNTAESLTYAFLTNSFRTISLNFPDPYHPEDYYVAIKARRARPPSIRVEISPEGIAQISIRVVINGVVNIAQNPEVDYLADPQKRQELEQYVAGILEQRGRDLLRKLQEEYAADILQLGRRVSGRFSTIPEWEDYNWREQFPQAEIDVSFQINL